tara:strand:+ start:880 stop:1293 length:414 start_codon:yes stop_codon:yes gene_type:complete
MGKPGKTAVPFTQKHFGTKGSMTDDSHNMTKGGAAMMKQSAIYMYGNKPIQQSASATKTRSPRQENESKEDYGRRVYNDAMSKVQKQQETSSKRRNAPKEKSMFPKVTSGMGSSFTTYKGPKITTGMGTSFTTRNKG